MKLATVMGCWLEVHLSEPTDYRNYYNGRADTKFVGFLFLYFERSKSLEGDNITLECFGRLVSNSSSKKKFGNGSHFVGCDRFSIILNLCIF